MKWYAFVPKAEEREVEVAIYDEIGLGGVTADDFIGDLKQHAAKHVHLRLNSVGGDVVQGNAIYNALRRHKGGLTVHIDGLAASMASVIASAAPRTLIADNGMMMLHNPWTVTMGDADDLRKEADLLDKIKKAMVTAYKRKSGKDTDEIVQMMDEETWLTAEQAVEAGLADAIEEGLEAAAAVTPEAARARFDKLKEFMAHKSANLPKAEEAAPEVVEQALETPVTDGAVDTSSDNMTADLQAKVDALQADLASKVEAEAAQAQASEDIAKELETLKAEVERLTAESASKDEEITALLAASKSAGEQAAAIVASVGLEPVAVMQAEPELTPAQIFNSLSGSDAVEYFRKNKREIIASAY
jgi:ATP-dependent Clp endopeptidase proteolytic subunit ClpP